LADFFAEVHPGIRSYVDYTKIVPRIRALLLSTLLAAALFAQEKKEPPPNVQEPKEEDEALIPKEYAFNPLQAEKELKVGNFYFKKGSYKAAAGRFREAVKWNPGFAEAWFRLGETEEKLKDKRAAEEAYRKFIELAPDDKRSETLKKILARKR
jgi:tetratricopeptide (TPR) repeat protein